MDFLERQEKVLRSNYQYRFAYGLIPALTILLASCVSSTSTPLILNQLHVSNQCGSHQQATLTIINDQDKLRKTFDSLHRTTMGQGTEPPTVNFKKYFVLQIEMGQKPTAGYSITIDKPSASLIDDKLVIKTNWQEPIQGHQLPQVITNPCLIVRVPVIKFKSIRVLDQGDKERVNYPMR